MNRKTNNNIAGRLDECAEASVSPEIQDKLNLARRDALSQLEQLEKTQSNSRWFFPIGFITMAASIVFVFFVATKTPVIIESDFPLVNEDMLVFGENLSLIEDLQFYEWMLLEET